MSSNKRSYRDEGYTVSKAVGDVFGRWPLWPWTVITAIVLGGVAGAIASAWLARGESPPRSDLRWAACAGYGIVLAALVTTLPRAWKLISLRSTLGHRPPTDASDRPWWPLRLLAAALRHTPTLRLTQQDFSGAVQQAVSDARALLTYRLWPACMASFVAPVLGLLSAWESGVQVEVKPGEGEAAVYMQVLPQISPPMVATISAALVLMVVLAILDQFTKGLLQQWASTVTLADAGSDFVKGLIGEGRMPDVPGAIPIGGISPPPVGGGAQHSTPPTPKPDAKIMAEELERLRDLFSPGR
jgi:hypothetical protein